MARKTLFISILCIFFISTLALAYTQPSQEERRHKVIGTLLLFSQTDLKVQKPVSASTRAVYNFKLTEKTKFIGTPEVGKTVSVSYLRKKLNKHAFRLIALSVEVLAD